MNVNNAGDSAQEQKVGMKCPQCGAFIGTSIFQLLTTNALVCPACQLRLRIDRMKSRQAFEALRKVEMARKNVEQKSKFSR